MPRTKKLASKPRFRGNKYARVNKKTGVPEKRQPLSDQSGESSCVKHNLSAWNKNIYPTSVNAEIYVGENLCKSESDCTQDGNTVVSINPLCAFIEKKTLITNVVVVIFLCLKIHQRRRVLQAM
jgi:hypothetical protein